MNSTEEGPILFYDLVAHEGAPFFSSYTVRARLAFALKRVPIKTIEISYHDLVHTWTAKLGVPKATVPFIQKPDGSYLMESLDIIQWLEEAYPDRPSVFLPEAEPPVDRASQEYKQRSDLDRAEFKQFAALAKAVWDEGFPVFAPVMYERFDRETQQYWTSEKRMGPGRWQRILDTDQNEAIAKCRRAVEQLAALLPPGSLFFASKTKPGIEDMFLLGSHRVCAATSPALERAVFDEGGLGEWLVRMKDFFGAEFAVVTERDPK